MRVYILLFTIFGTLCLTSSCDKDPVGPETCLPDFGGSIPDDNIASMFLYDPGANGDVLGMAMEFGQLFDTTAAASGIAIDFGSLGGSAMILNFNLFDQDAPFSARMTLPIVTDENFFVGQSSSGPYGDEYNMLITDPSGEYIADNVEVNICSYDQGALSLITRVEGIFNGDFVFDDGSSLFDEIINVSGTFRYTEQ